MWRQVRRRAGIENGGQWDYALTLSVKHIEWNMILTGFKRIRCPFIFYIVDILCQTIFHLNYYSLSLPQVVPPKPVGKKAKQIASNCAHAPPQQLRSTFYFIFHLPLMPQFVFTCFWILFRPTRKYQIFRRKKMRKIYYTIFIHATCPPEYRCVTYLRIAIDNKLLFFPCERKKLA